MTEFTAKEHWKLKNGFSRDTVVMQPPLTPGDARTSQHCILACTAGIASWCAVNWDDLAQHFPCPCTRAVSWVDQALPDCTWNSSCLESHLPGNCTFWVALDLYSCCLHHVDFDQDGMMPKVNHLETL